MGAVHEEQRNEGRGCQEWYKMSLTDPSIIKTLIQNRSKLDGFYIAKKYATDNPYISNGVPMFTEPVCVMYLDLDKLIDECAFDMRQKFIIGKLMLGYNEADIAWMLKSQTNTIKKRFETICARIKEQNDEDWKEYIEIDGLVKIPADCRYKKCTKCGRFKRVTEEFWATDSRNNDGFRAYCKDCR